MATLPADEPATKQNKIGERVLDTGAPPRGFISLARRDADGGERWTVHTVEQRGGPVAMILGKAAAWNYLQDTVKVTGVP